MDFLGSSISPEQSLFYVGIESSIIIKLSPNIQKRVAYILGPSRMGEKEYFWKGGREYFVDFLRDAFSCDATLSRKETLSDRDVIEALSRQI